MTKIKSAVIFERKLNKTIPKDNFTIEELMYIKALKEKAKLINEEKQKINFEYFEKNKCHHVSNTCHIRE